MKCRSLPWIPITLKHHVKKVRDDKLHQSYNKVLVFMACHHLRIHRYVIFISYSLFFLQTPPLTFPCTHYQLAIRSRPAAAAFMCRFTNYFVSCSVCVVLKCCVWVRWCAHLNATLIRNVYIRLAKQIAHQPMSWQQLSTDNWLKFKQGTRMENKWGLKWLWRLWTWLLVLDSRQVIH